jgi:sulfite exporter TauE/SafE/copper chaperone CopZ
MDATKQYQINGMHCASCELLIKTEFEKFPGVKVVVADSATQQVVIRCSDNVPTTADLNASIREFGYEIQTSTAKNPVHGGYLPALSLATVILVVFAILERSSSAIATPAASGVAAAFFLGLVASVSSCAALVGGLVLSVSRDWNSATNPKPWPLLQFNVGRLLAFALLGALLGTFGAVLTPTVEFNVFLVVIVSGLMILLGLQMLDLPFFNNIKLRLPGNLGERLLKTKNADFKYSPFLLGFGTFLLPCGFTLAAQAQALSSGNALTGSLILTAFALATLPMLTAIGLSARYLSLNKSTRALFLKTAGIVVIVFAIYTINNQLNVLGLPSLSDLFN